MIKTIDDLRGCYAVRADKEVFELFMDKCEEFGVVWSGSGEQPRGIKSGEAVVFSGFDKGMLTHDRLEGMQRKDYKRLTLSDFKPTRTEYVQVTESASHVIDEFENGGNFYYMAPSLTKPAMANRDGVFNKLRDGESLYRRVEKVVDWREELISEFDFVSFNMSCNSVHLKTWPPIKEKQFLELCRVALRANGEID